MSRYALLLLLVTLVGCGRGDAPADGAGEPAGAGTVALTAPAPDGGAVHIVRMVARGGEYGFEPSEVRVRSGDVVRFVQTGFQPEAIAFDTAGVPAGGADFLERQGVLRGPLLTEPGSYFDVVFDDAPSGEYHFFSVPHREAGLNGRVVVDS
jgi:plastocyanin